MSYKFLVRILILNFLLIMQSNLFSADRYWVGGGSTTNWNATANTNWSATSGGGNNASVPTSSDNVYFDANSGAGNAVISASITIRSIDCTGYTGTIIHNAAVNLTIGYYANTGTNTALKFVSGFTYTLGNASTSAIIFTSSFPVSLNVDFAGKTTGNVTFDSLYNNWTLTGAHTTSTTSTVTLTSGMLNTNGQAISWGHFASNNDNNPRSLTFGSSNINLTGTGNVWVLTSASSGNLQPNFDPGTSTITINDISATSKTFAGNDRIYNNITFSGDNIIVTGSSFFNTFNVQNANLANGLLLTAGTTQTVTSFTTNGFAGNLAKILSVTAGTPAIISKITGNITVDYLSIKDITASTTGNTLWYAGANSSNVSGNSGWIFTASAPSVRYWVIGGVSTNWSDTLNWSLTSGGAGGASVPGSSDIVYLDQNSGAGFSDINNDTTIRSLNCTGFKGNLRHFATTKLTIGNGTANDSNIALKFVSSMTYTLGNVSTSSLEFVTSNTPIQTIDFAGKITGDVNYNNTTGSWKLIGEQSTGTTATVTMTNGILNTNNQKVTWGHFISTSGTMYVGSSDITLSGVGTVWNATGLTFYATTSIIKVTDTSSTSKTFAGAVKTYNKVIFAGDNISVTGSNTFSELSVQNAGLPNGLLLEAGSTQTVTSFTSNGYASNLAILKSTVNATPAILTKASGRVSVDYMSIKDSTAATTGAATWFAGANSLNVSGNGGGVPWSFTKPSGLYWIGGTDTNWTTAANWSSSSGGTPGAVAPSAATDIFIDGNSGTGNIVINNTATARSLNTTGYTGTLTHNAFTLTIGDASPGIDNIALKFGASMTYVVSNVTTSAITFNSTSTTVQTVDFAGKTTGTVDYNGAGGSWKMTGAHTTINAAVKLTTGTLNTNSQTCTWGAFYLSGLPQGGVIDNIRTLTLGSSQITLQHDTSYLDAYTWFANATNNLIVTPNSATLTIVANGTRAFRSVGIDWKGLSLIFDSQGGTPTLFFTSTGGILKSISVTGVNWLGVEDRLDVNNFGCVITNSLNLNGYSSGKRLRVSTNGPNGFIRWYTRTFDITGASVNCSNVDFNGIGFVSGNAAEIPKDLSNSTGGIGDLGNNSGIIFTPSMNLYWYSDSTGTKSWSDKSNWFSAPKGGGVSPRIPLPQDNAIFDDESFATSGISVDADIRRLCKDITWTGVKNSPNWHFSVDTQIFGSIELCTGMTMSCYSTAVLYLAATSQDKTINFNPAGITFPHTGVFFNWPNYSIQKFYLNIINFQGNFQGNSTDTTGIYVSGIANLNNYNITVGQFKIGTGSNSGTLDMGASYLKITGADNTNPNTTFNCACMLQQNVICGTSTVDMANNGSLPKTHYNGGGIAVVLNKYKISGIGNATYTYVQGITYNEFEDANTSAHTLLFQNGTTSTFTGPVTINGSVGNLITIGSVNTANPNLAPTGNFTWSKASGSIDGDYLIISRSTTTGGAAFNAKNVVPNSSIDGGGNSGWNFLTLPPCTWTGANFAVNINWDNPANWSVRVPLSADIAYFTSYGTRSCNINIDPNCKGIYISSSYPATITQQSAITLDTNGFEMNGGTFVGATQNITNTGFHKHVGGSFKHTNGIYEITAQGTSIDTWREKGGTTILGTGTVKINGPKDANISTTWFKSFNTVANENPFYHLELNTIGTVSGNNTVNGNLTRSVSAPLDADITLKGNYLPLNGPGTSAGNGIIRFTNTTASQDFSYQYAPRVSIVKTAQTLNINDDLFIGSSWSYSSGTIAWNNKTTTFENTSASGITISSGTFYNMTIAKNSSDILITGLCSVANLFTINSLANLNASSVASTIEVSGNYVSNDTLWGGTSKIVLKGATANTFIGTGKQGVSMEVYKPGGSLELWANMDIPNAGHNLVVRSGNLDLRGFNLTVKNALTVYGTMTLKGSEVITVNSLTTPAVTNPNFTISATSSTIIYTDSAVTANVSKLGKSFYNLTLGASKVHEFDTGVPNTTTVAGVLGSNGTSGTRSILRSAANVSTDWYLTLSGTSTLTNKVSVKRSYANLPGVNAVGSVNAGNNTNWFGLLTVPIVTINQIIKY